jgi:hypothetical protein
MDAGSAAAARALEVKKGKLKRTQSGAIVKADEILTLLKKQSEPPKA